MSRDVDVLEEVLADLHGALPDAEGSAKAAIAREIRITLAELRDLAPAVTKGSTADEVAAKRAQRANADTPPARRRAPRGG